MNNVENFINKLENEKETAFTLEVTPQAKADLGYLAQKIESSKIEKYIEFLKTNTEFDTEFYDIGDGLSVSTWKHE